MVKVRVENADESLPELMSFLFQRGIKLHTLSVQKPSLDEVFLQYTGRSLREEGPADRMKVMMNMRRVRRT
jgi:ABC-2 type transport system ATP-binding protein